MNAMNRTFWKNIKPLMCKQASFQSRLKFWKRLCFSCVDHMLPGLRPSAHAGEHMEAYSNKLVSRMAKIPTLADDTPASYKIRKNSYVARMKQTCAFDFRYRWAYKLTTWTEHLYRHKDAPSFLLVRSQDDEWLRTCRMLMGSFGAHRSLEGGSTGTRSSSGFPVRWGERWLEFIEKEGGGWENPNRSKSISKSRAYLLAANFLKKGVQRLCLTDE